MRKQKQTMLTDDIYNKVGVVAKSVIELPSSDDYIARINEGTQRDAVSPNHQEVTAVKTHWDCDKQALSFALAEEDGGVNGHVERDGAIGIGRFMLNHLRLLRGPGIDSEA